MNTIKNGSAKIPDYEYYSKYKRRNLLYGRASTLDARYVFDSNFFSNPLKYFFWVISGAVCLSIVFYIVALLGYNLPGIVLVSVIGIVPIMIYTNIINIILHKLLYIYGYEVSYRFVMIYVCNIAARNENIMVGLVIFTYVVGLIACGEVYDIFHITYWYLGMLPFFLILFFNSLFMSVNFWRRFYDLPYSFNVKFLALSLSFTFIFFGCIFLVLLLIKPYFHFFESYPF